MHVTNDYMLLSARFASVRRAWKRNTALGGLAIVVTEGVGLFTVLLFLDWLYHPQPLVRLAFSGAALIGLCWLIARHVVKPLLRKIPDEQIALYIEEHRTGLEGVLITAAEFSKKREGVTDRQASLIDAVIAQASQRSAKMQIASIADFSRLKKYGIGALAGICVYALLGALFPSTFAHHFGRVLAPWHATEEDVARHEATAALAEPLHFTLSKGDSSLARGSSFDLEVTLSKAKPTGQGVVINFRSKAGGDWQQLPMTEIEKLNGFQGTLPDVSEDLEFFITCGTDKSDTFHLTVFDPLVVQSLETIVHFPDYLKQPDEVTRPSTGDVTAVVGSTVTLRVLTSTTLKDGQIKWSDGTTQPMAVDPKAPDTETVSFPVQKDGAYDFSVSDVIGQQAVSPASLTVHAVVDMPPTVQIKAPQQSPVLTNMVGEVNFVVDAGDDFGVEGLDFIYSRVDAQGKSVETRMPLTYSPVDSKDTPHAVEASYHLQLEDFNPPVQPNDAISYHFEAHDAKGQKAVSPLSFIIIGNFEQWGTWAAAAATSHLHNDTAPDIMAVMAMVWDLNNDRPQLPPDDFTKRSADVAGKMVDAQGNVVDFVNLAEMPQLAKVDPLIRLHTKNAHDALVKQDTATATTEMSTAAALYVGNGLLATADIHSATPQSTVGSHFNSPQLTMLEQARLDALSAAAPDKSRKEDEQSQSSAAAAAAKRIADLLKQQDALLAKAQAESAATSQPADKDAASKANAMPSAGASGSGASGQSSSSAAKSAELAKAQQALADPTRALSQGAHGGGGGGGMQKASDKTGAAAKLMEEAARAFAAGKNSEGQDKAGQAKAALQSAGAELQGTDRDKLEAAISAARSHASVLLDKLKDLNAATSGLAGQLGGKAPDQRQQRDLEKQAYQQTQLGAQAEALNDEIGTLNQRAQQNGQPEVQRALDDTQHVVRRSQPQAKLASAAVDLNNANAASADAEQKSAIDSLQKIVDGLNAGSDALAATRDAQLKRAQRIAQDARAGLAALTGAGAGQQAKSGGAAATAEAKAQTGDTSGAKAQSGGAGPTGGMTSGGGEDQARDLADKITRLAAVTDNRDLIKQDLVDQLKQLSMDKTELEKKLLTDPKFLQDATQIVGSVSDKIEAELDAKTQAGKLYSSQREECPPTYRQFVNQYFEALSHVAPAPASAPAPQ